MSDLRQRCGEFYQRLSRDAMLRQGDPVQSILEFVVAETGRKAEPALKDTLPLCLYFRNAEEREAFVALMLEARPDMISRRI